MTAVVSWLHQLGFYPVLDAGVCLVLAVVVAVLRQLAHRSPLGRRMDGPFALLVFGLLCGALAVWARAVGLSAVEPYLNAVFAGAVAIGLVRAFLTVFVDFYLSRREGAQVSAIVRDVASVIAYFLVIVVVLRSTLDINLASLIATSAVLTVIVGLALQDVLSNFIGGIVLELEAPVEPGDWVRVGAFEGVVEETGWRTTKLRTRINELITLPNAMMSKEAVVNYSRPDPRYGDTLHVDVVPDAPPNAVKSTVLRVLMATPGVLHDPLPEVRVEDYRESGIQYALRFWIDDFAARDRIRSRVLTDLWYALRRAQLRLPFPTRDLFLHAAPDVEVAVPSDAVAALRGVSLLAPLDDAALAQLAQRVHRQSFGQGEIVVHEGEPGDSFYVIERGAVEVMIGRDGNAQAVGQLCAGEFFGEMSLLAGEARTATVRAATDLEVLVVDRAAFREILSADPAILEPLSEIAHERQAAQQVHRRRRAAAGERATADAAGVQSLRERIKAFFGI